MSTPYQIRADLLKLSRDILESQSRAKKNKRMGSSHTFFPEGDEEITTEQIMAEAQKLNGFVSQNFSKNLVEGDLIVRGNVIADEDVKAYEADRYKGLPKTR